MSLKNVIEDKRTAILLSLLCFLILLLFFTVGIMLFERKKVHQKTDTVFITVDPSVLVLPDEPLTLPPVQYSRKQKKVWTEKDLHYWYTIPDNAQMSVLQEKNNAVMKTLWESIP